MTKLRCSYTQHYRPGRRWRSSGTFGAQVGRPETFNAFCWCCPVLRRTIMEASRIVLRVLIISVVIPWWTTQNIQYPRTAEIWSISKECNNISIPAISTRSPRVVWDFFEDWLAVPRKLVCKVLRGKWNWEPVEPPVRELWYCLVFCIHAPHCFVLKKHRQACAPNGPWVLTCLSETVVVLGISLHAWPDRHA